MTSPSAPPPDRPTAVFLGADAGGSHSTVVIGTQSGVLGRADGPGAAMRPGGAAKSAAVLAETARRAAAQAGMDLPVERAVVGAAGAGRAQEQAELEAALVDAGVARARDPAGELHRAGGYGWQLGDEGGGYWLGRRALDVAARSQDGRGEGSTLLARLLGALGLQHFDDLVRWTATATPAQMAALAPHVLNAAREGEGVARQAVDDAARELVELVGVLVRHFPGTGPVPVALAGGLLLTQSPLTAAFRERLGAALKRARLVPDRTDSALGALRLAAELE
ncbi:MAG: hypothetical protein DMD60_11510 [Gemmatimonadetes bacterium]|nr:MAG: hypothetical protein DMD60_11510 [Gemmatimonadota bacterium]